MPVPVPRQRAVPAMESCPAPAASGSPAGHAPAEAAPVQDATGPGTPAAGDTGDPDDDRPAVVDNLTNLTLLVIEDDPAGALGVPRILDGEGKPIRIRTARNLTEAERLLTDDVHCILLDLALPAPGRAGRAGAADDELTTLRHVLRLAPRHARRR